MVPLIGRVWAGRRFWNPGCLRRRVGCLRLQAESDCVRPCAACCIRSAGTVLLWRALWMGFLQKCIFRPLVYVRPSLAPLAGVVLTGVLADRSSLVLSNFRVSILFLPGKGGFSGFPSCFVNLTKYTVRDVAILSRPGPQFPSLRSTLCPAIGVLLQGNHQGPRDPCLQHWTSRAKPSLRRTQQHACLAQACRAGLCHDETDRSRRR